MISFYHAREGRTLVTEQIAGDLLPRLAALHDLASGFTEARKVPNEVGHAQRGQPGLPHAEQIARTARLQILLGDLESVRRPLEHFEPPSCFFAHATADDQSAPRGSRAPAHAAPQLVELCETKRFGVLDD